MLITFKSLIKQGDEKKKIEFTAKVKVSTFNDMKVYEFEDPQSKLMNRIEINDKSVNIFAGVMSLNLVLDQSVPITYATQFGNVFLTTHMNFLEHSEQRSDFKYILQKDGQTIGEYKLQLLLH